MSANSYFNKEGGLHKRLPFALLLGILVLMLSNATLLPGQSATGEASETIPSEWRDTKDEVIRDVLEYMQKNDLRGLTAITVSAEDYKTVVWPELPISNPRNNIPFEYVFGRHNQLSRGGLTIKLREFADRHFEVVSFEVRPERDKYEHIHIYPVGKVVIRDADGKTFDARLIGSILEYNGKFKAFSYKTD